MIIKAPTSDEVMKMYVGPPAVCLGLSCEIDESGKFLDESHVRVEFILQPLMDGVEPFIAPVLLMEEQAESIGLKPTHRITPEGVEEIQS